jgi:hypothetical protein
MGGVVEYNDMPTPDNFDDAAAAIVEIQKSITRHSIVGYWLIGKMVSDMQSAEAVYGSGITERVALELSKSGDKTCKKIVEEAHRAYKRCPNRGDLEKIADMGIKWSQLRAINRIGDTNTRKKVIKEVVTQGLNAAATTKHVRQTLEGKAAAAPAPVTPARAELPADHPTSYFQSVASRFNAFEGKVDRSEKELKDISSSLEDIVRLLPDNIDRSGDVDLLDDNQFGMACDACKSISEKANILIDRIRIHQRDVNSLAMGIEAVLVQKFKDLDKEVTWGDE